MTHDSRPTPHDPGPKTHAPKTISIIGAGHNGLVAATLLAKAGLDVDVYEQKGQVGGASKTEYPFEKAPNVAQSTGAYLLGLMPPELIEKLDIELPTLRRDPHYFVPTTDGRYLLFGSDKEAMKRQFIDFFSEDDWRAYQKMQDEIAALREDLAPAWLEPPMSIEETAEEYIRPDLREVFVDLCRGSVGEYLSRFEYNSDLIQAMYAVTDSFTGSYAGWDTPGGGMNFLIHNMCRLPESDGTWMIVEGGMGTVSEKLAGAAKDAGANIHLNAPVESILTENGEAVGVELQSGEQISSDAVLTNADPFTSRNLVGKPKLPDDYNETLDARERPGSTLKVNLCLSELPEFECLPEQQGQHRTTIHILPDEDEVLAKLDEGFEDVRNGRLPEFPSIEWYIHTTVDETLKDEEGRHSAALFVQWVPYELAEGSWDQRAEDYAEHLLDICDDFAPGTSDLVEDMFILTPKKIESHFGIHKGHIHHIDNTFGFDDRHPYEYPIDGLYSCSAGCHPGGSVIGAAGHNAAQQILD